MLVRRLGMAVSLGRFFVALGAVSPTMMLGGRTMAPGGVFVVFSGLGMGFISHCVLPWV